MTFKLGPSGDQNELNKGTKSSTFGQGNCKTNSSN